MFVLNRLVPVIACIALVPLCAQEMAPEAAAGATVATVSDVPPAIQANRLANADYQAELNDINARILGKDKADRLRALTRIVELRDVTTEPLVLEMLAAATHDAEELQAACRAMAALRFVNLTPAVKSLLAHPDVAVRQSALTSVIAVDALDEKSLQSLLKDTDAAIRYQAIVRLAMTGGAESQQQLHDIVNNDPDRRARVSAAHGLARLGNPAGVEHLKIALTDSSPVVREAAAEALVQLKAKEAIPDLLFAIEADPRSYRLAGALKALAGDDFGIAGKPPGPERDAAIAKAWEAVAISK